MNLIKKSRKYTVWNVAMAIILVTNLLGFNSIAHAQVAALVPSMPLSLPTTVPATTPSSPTPTFTSAPANSLPAIIHSIEDNSSRGNNGSNKNNNNNDHGNNNDNTGTVITTPVGTITTTTEPITTTPTTEPTTTPSVYDKISPAVIKPEAPVPTETKEAPSTDAALTAKQAAAQQDLINQMMQTVIPMDPYIAKGFKPLTTNVLYGISGLVAIAGIMLMFGKPTFIARHLVALFSFS